MDVGASIQAVPHVPVPTHVQNAVRADYKAIDDTMYTEHVMLIAALYGNATAGTPLPAILDPQQLATKKPEFNF